VCRAAVASTTIFSVAALRRAAFRGQPSALHQHSFVLSGKGHHQNSAETFVAQRDAAAGVVNVDVRVRVAL